MLTSSRTSVPKTQRNTLGNSTTLSLKKERYVNRVLDVQLSGLFISLQVFFFVLSQFSVYPRFILSVFVRPPKGNLGNIFEGVFYLPHRRSAVCQSYL